MYHRIRTGKAKAPAQPQSHAGAILRIRTGERCLPEPVALLDDDIGYNNADHHKAARNEECPVHLSKAEVLRGEQILARRVRAQGVIFERVQELPLGGDGVIEVDAAVGGIITGKGDLHRAGQCLAVVQDEVNAVLRGGKGEARVHRGRGVFDAAAHKAEAVAVAVDHQRLIVGAQGVQGIRRDHRSFLLGEGHRIGSRVLNGGDDRIRGSLVGRGAVTGVVAVAGSGGRAVDDDRHRGGDSAIGDDDRGGTRAYAGDDAAAVDGSDLGVVGFESQALGGRGGGYAARDGLAGTRLEHHIVGVQGEGLRDGRAAGNDFDVRRSAHAAAGKLKQDDDRGFQVRGKNTCLSEAL